MPAIDTIPTQQSATPATQQNNSTGAGLAILSSLLEQRKALTSDLGSLTKAAMTPVAVPSGTSPQNAIAPVHQFQPAPLIDRPTVGARSTRDKGIANAIIGMTNLVGQYEQKDKEEKQRVLSVDIERLMQAQNGMSQAQQVLSANPNNSDAKAALEKNGKIVNALLSDPKRRKAIGKALDINFVDPSQNTSDEHGALKQATNSYADQLKAQSPTQLTPNVQAQQQLALKSAQVASADKMIDTIAPVLIREQGADTRNIRNNDTKGVIAQLQSSTRTYVADTNNKVREQINNTNNAVKQKLMSMSTGAAMARVQAQVAGRMNYLQTKDADFATQAKVNAANITAWNSAIKQVDAEAKNNALFHANKQMDDATFNAKQSYLDGQRQMLQNFVQAATHQNTLIANVRMGADINGQPATSTGASSEQSALNTFTGPATDSDADQDDPDYYGTGQ